MFPSNTINDELSSQLGVDALFDFYRVVDNRTHEVMEYPKGAAQPSPTGTTCHHIWGDKGPCPNCTSRSCVAHHKTIVKIMHLDGTVFLIYSVPVVIAGQDYALELIKDVTDSFMVPSQECNDNIEITYAIERFNELAVHDSFTGLYNKNYIINELQEIIDRCAEEGVAPKADLVMLDLDLFKNINDTYGHNAGDDILLYFALMLNKVAQEFEDGWAARFGGDEFVLCAPHGITEADKALVEDMLQQFAAHHFESIKGDAQISASYGITHVLPTDSASDVIDRADVEMYRMKEAHHKNMAEKPRCDALA